MSRERRFSNNLDSALQEAMATSSINGSPIPGPIVLSSWLSANADKLQPPVNNLCLYSGKDFILMAVGGPNTRIDYHGGFPYLGFMDEAKLLRLSWLTSWMHK